MEIETLEGEFTVCLIDDPAAVDVSDCFCFLSRTDEELSLVCRSELVPASAAVREDGFRAFRIKGDLDFSLIGILASITSLLAENRISVFVVSTFRTDYVFVKKDRFDEALQALNAGGYRIPGQ